MATENESAWSTTAAANASVDAGINWAEGQDAATVNNSARGMMTARRKAALDQGGALVAGGTADALTVTTNQVLSAAHLVAGQRLAVRATADNATTTPTFAPDGLTPVPIKRADGSALAVGSIKNGMMLDLVYNVGSSEWRAINIAPFGQAQMGVTDGSNAAAGQVGEFLSATGSGVAMSNGAAVNVVTLALTAGDWDVWGGCTMAFSTGASSATAGISTVANTSPAVNLQDVLNLNTAGITARYCTPPAQRINLAAGGNVYMIAAASFGGTCTGGGILMARRRR